MCFHPPCSAEVASFVGIETVIAARWKPLTGDGGESVFPGECGSGVGYAPETRCGLPPTGGCYAFAAKRRRIDFRAQPIDGQVTQILPQGALVTWSWIAGSLTRR